MRPVMRPVMGPVMGPVTESVAASAGPADAGWLDADWLADRAVRALVEEAELTPKPALVDRRGSGAHPDMDLGMLRRSARALRPTFRGLADRARGREPCVRLREELAAIGRGGEGVMLAATGGVNTHRGAIWAVGLLAAAAAMAPGAPADGVAALAGRVAAFPDRHAPAGESHGSVAVRRYGVAGAREEARRGFPNVVDVALPALREARAAGRPERLARLDALLALISEVDDTCLLHRGGAAALAEAKAGARAVLAAGGTATPAGGRALRILEAALLRHNASPGGSADLLCAALFLDGLENAPPGGDDLVEVA